MSVHAEKTGGVLRLTLDHGKGNVLDRVLIDRLSAALACVGPDVRAVVLCAAGPEFCYGASVEEHRVETVGQMLKALHRLLHQVLLLPVPVLAAVRGRCLGGGLELALACTRIFADETSVFGQPEISLGLMAPAASALLPERIGQPHATELLLTGRQLGAEEAQLIGLIDELVPNLVALATERARWMTQGSPSSLRVAHRAARARYVARVVPAIDELERLYLEELAHTPDAREGIEAFLARRAPRWAGNT